MKEYVVVHKLACRPKLNQVESISQVEVNPVIQNSIYWFIPLKL